MCLYLAFLNGCASTFSFKSMFFYFVFLIDVILLEDLRGINNFNTRPLQAARSALLSYEDVSRMLNDLSKIDFSEILSKSFFISENKGIFIKTKTCKWILLIYTCSVINLTPGILFCTLYSTF